MAADGTPLRQKFLIRGVVGHVLQNPNDVNLDIWVSVTTCDNNQRRIGGRDDVPTWAPLSEPWGAHRRLSCGTGVAELPGDPWMNTSPKSIPAPFLGLAGAWH